MAGSKLSILGYYRSHTRPDLHLEQSDLAVIDRWFSSPDSLFLIVKPLDLTHMTAELFARQNGRLPTQSAGREFQYQGRGAGASHAAEPVELAAPEEAPPLEDVVPIATREEPAPPIEIPETPAVHAVRPPQNEREPRPPKELFMQHRRRGFVARHWKALAALVLVTGAGGLFFWQNWGGGDADETSQPVSQAVSQPASQPTSEPATLGLDVRPDAGAWHVAWKSDQPAIRNALRGALIVEDGPSHKEIPLTQEQLRAGGLPYKHQNDDLTFRLRVFGPGDRSSMELFRVLLAAKPGAAKPVPAVQTAALESKPVPPAVIPKAPPAAPPAAALAKSAAPAEKGRHIVPAEVMQRVRPEITEGIRSRITENTVVLVKVTIDSNGSVTSAVPISHGTNSTARGILNFAIRVVRIRHERGVLARSSR